MTLADPQPIDVALTIGYVVALLLAGSIALRTGTPGRERAVWAGLTGLLLILVVNQQTDLHAPLLEAGGTALESFGVSSFSPSVRLVAAVAIVAIAIAVGAAGHAAIRGSRAPMILVVAGVLLLMVHAVGRAARFLHVFQGVWADTSLATALKWAEGIGLALLIGGLLWIIRTRAHQSESPRTTFP